MRYFIRFSYNGTEFHGSQMQGNATTVQEVMEKAFCTIFQIRVPLSFAGRTDTGVHASEMYANFSSPIPLPITGLAHRLNCLLPDSIYVSDIFPVPDTLHARFSAISRTYKYYITTEKAPFKQDGITIVQRGLDFKAMNKAAKLLLGRHDFASFCKTKHESKTTLCTVMKAEWKVSKPRTRHLNQFSHKPLEGECTAVFTIKANRFLRNMVRAVVGTLLDVGRGKITIGQFQEIIDARSRVAAGASAPAEGLYLVHIEYPPFKEQKNGKPRKLRTLRRIRRHVRKFFKWKLKRFFRELKRQTQRKLSDSPLSTFLPFLRYNPADNSATILCQRQNHAAHEYVAPETSATDLDS